MGGLRLPPGTSVGGVGSVNQQLKEEDTQSEDRQLPDSLQAPDDDQSSDSSRSDSSASTTSGSSDSTSTDSSPSSSDSSGSSVPWDPTVETPGLTVSSMNVGNTNYRGKTNPVEAGSSVALLVGGEAQNVSPGKEWEWTAEKPVTVNGQQVGTATFSPTDHDPSYGTARIDVSLPPNAARVSVSVGGETKTIYTTAGPWADGSSAGGARNPDPTNFGDASASTTSTDSSPSSDDSSGSSSPTTSGSSGSTNAESGQTVDMSKWWQSGSGEPSSGSAPSVDRRTLALGGLALLGVAVSLKGGGS